MSKAGIIPPGQKLRRRCVLAAELKKPNGTNTSLFNELATRAKNAGGGTECAPGYLARWLLCSLRTPGAVIRGSPDMGKETRAAWKGRTTCASKTSSASGDTSRARLDEDAPPCPLRGRSARSLVVHRIVCSRICTCTCRRKRQTMQCTCPPAYWSHCAGRMLTDSMTAQDAVDAVATASLDKEDVLGTEWAGRDGSLLSALCSPGPFLCSAALHKSADCPGSKQGTYLYIHIQYLYALAVLQKRGCRARCCAQPTGDRATEPCLLGRPPTREKPGPARMEGKRRVLISWPCWPGPAPAPAPRRLRRETHPALARLALVGKGRGRWSEVGIGTRYWSPALRFPP